jgi:uncharacterized membrane protein YkvA (DUF1232 family)
VQGFWGNCTKRCATERMKGNNRSHPATQEFFKGCAYLALFFRNPGMNLKSLAQRFKAQLKFYRDVRQDLRTPRVAKILLGLALAYTLSPVDVIPDFIPVIGYLDDVLIVGVLVMLAMRLVPREVCEENKIS